MTRLGKLPALSKGGLLVQLVHGVRLFLSRIFHHYGELLSRNIMSCKITAGEKALATM